MIEKLQIRNFQKHKKLSIDFSPNVTTIIGRTDAGKSAIIRALRWVLLNKPSGDSFIKEGSKEAKAKVKTNGKYVTRKRSKQGNVYIFRKKELKSFGSSVPDIVADRVNVSDINFQEQHDSPFWFANSAAEVSRKLNEIVDLGIIDDVLNETSRQVRQASSETNVRKSNLRELRSEKKALSFVPELKKDFAAIEDAQKRLQEHRDELESVRNTLEELEKNQDRCRLLSNVSKYAKTDLQSIEELIKERHALIEKKKDVEETLNSIEEQKQKAEQHDKEAKELEKELHKKLKGKCPLCHQKIKQSP